MKLTKSTTILLNVVLVLIIALLVKFVIVSPKNVYAQGSSFSYKFAYVGPTQEEIQQTGRPTASPEQLEQKINAIAQEGWKLHSISLVGSYIAIFERSH